MIDLRLLEAFVFEVLFNEAKKRPGNKNYYGGTKKSNKQMAREIKKCDPKGKPKGWKRPKSCYDYWSADKTYDKSKKKSK
jgi:hypothetical protein